MKPAPLLYTPPSGPLHVLHRDDDLLVLSKPAGLLSVPGKDPAQQDCLEHRAKADFPEALLVHRLDMSTSGLFIMAMNKAAQGRLGQQFERRKIHKTYIARVWGRVEGESGHIDLPLCCDWPNRPLQMVCHVRGRSAQTDWEIIAREEASTTLRLTPLTGRSHQLRVHMKELGHPILGDPLYAPEPAKTATPRLMLHAQSLTLYHPKTGERISFQDEAGF